MMKTLTLFMCLIGCGLSKPSKDAIEDMCGPVIYLNTMFRHGARNTETAPPKDPYRSPKYWPGGLGALTSEGILQHLRLGKWMAKRYHHLLPEDNVNINNAIKVVSTDWNRTLMSAESEMAGMFPITKNTQCWEGLTSYPVPIHSLPEDHDAVSGFHHEPDAEVKEKKRLAILKDTVPFYFERFDKIIKENNGYLANGKLSWADIVLFGFSDTLNAQLQDDVFSTYPNIKGWRETIAGIPSIKEWISKRPNTKL